MFIVKHHYLCSTVAVCFVMGKVNLDCPRENSFVYVQVAVLLLFHGFHLILYLIRAFLEAIFIIIM